MSSAMSPGGSKSNETRNSSGSHSESPASSSKANYLDSTNPSRPTGLSARLQIAAARIPSFYITPFCGASAGVASGIVTCPLDVIKTKLQAQGGFQVRRNGKLVPSQTMYRGMFGTGRLIWKEEGLRGMYRGLGPMLLGYLPTWAVYLTVYDRSREYFHHKTDNWWLARFYASVTAGSCSTVATNPIWVIKTRLMSQRVCAAGEGVNAPWHYRNTIDAARKMYMNEGMRAFYSGLTPALLGLSHVAIQFPLYEYFKMGLTGYGIGEHPDSGNSHWIGISLATFLSKICASTATYPHEVLRTRLQTQQRSSPAFSPEGIAFRGALDQSAEQGRLSGAGAGASSSDGMANRPRYTSIVRTCQTILREEGWRAFYAGIGTNLIRAIPAAMTTMLTYEYLKNIIHRAQHDGDLALAVINQEHEYS